jgi:3-oxoacyl-[acyl-carrier protein] reductase
MSGTPGYFVGKTLVVTGAASGMGRAAALIFAREGANIVCSDIETEGLKQTEADILEKGGKVLAVECDITSRAHIEAMIATGLEKFGQIHFQFNSAGAALRRAKFLDIDDELFRKTFELNVNGTFYAMQAVLPHMLENGLGVIVNVSSMQHKRGGPGASVHYAAAKAAVLTMTLGVAREYADRGIRCLSISPGPFRTRFQESAQTSPELMAQIREGVPMKRFGEPEEIGELVLFMCSDACTFMTADTVYVNGGSGWR